VGALRVSLLLAIGAVPVACGGTTQRGDQDGEGADTGSGGSGMTGAGGTKLATAGRSTGSAGTVGKLLPPSGGTGAGGATQTLPSCTGGKLDPLTGLATCREGYARRVVKVACAAAGGAPADASAGASSGGAGGDHAPRVKPRANGSVSCETVNAGGYSGVEDCSRFEYGYCQNYGGFQASCASGCVQDGDCGAGAICECGHPESPTGGICVGANDCSTDADCAAGYFCATYSAACGYHAFACMKPEDECRSNDDCNGEGYCDSLGGHRVCNDAVCGRPFLVDAAARVAPVVSGGDWNAPGQAPCVEHLTGREREALAGHWSRLGQMEHASIAAFARFNLQLLSLGAPSELVEQCTRALADETAHTKLCFRLASAYAGRTLGPGALDVAGSLAVTTLEQIVDLVLVEGCIGETSAALEALEAADTASDPVIRAAYTQIAADEQRHAALAFRFLRWALEQDAALVAGRVVAALAATELSGSATRSVIEPCLSALLTLHRAA
jgi:hypothetical protein